MADGQTIVTSNGARTLSSTTKSAPIWSPRTPRWILEFLRTQALVPVEGGTYQINHVIDDEAGTQIHPEPLLYVASATLKASHSHPDQTPVESSAALYETAPREIRLQPVQSIVKIPNRVPALYSDHHDQLQSQLRVNSEFIYETAENMVFNHPDYGLLNNVAPRMQFQAEGPPTPDVLDDLLALAWRRPDLFVMHPDTLAELRKQANAQSLRLEEVEIFGSSFSTWRGLPIVPSNKLHLVADEGTRGSGEKGKGKEGKGKEGTARVRGIARTSILVMRLGEAKQGIVYLCPKGVEGNLRQPSITVDFMGLDDQAMLRYLLTAYTAVAVLSSGALARADVRV